MLIILECLCLIIYKSTKEWEANAHGVHGRKKEDAFAYLTLLNIGYMGGLNKSLWLSVT